MLASHSTAIRFWGANLGDGNVHQIANNLDGNLTQNFVYDSLNRISQAYTTGPSWGETYGPVATSPGVPPSPPGIDPWGNLTKRSGVIGKTYYEPLNCLANGNNQLTTCSMGYDAAGNMTSNGSVTYTYDAENRLSNTAGFTYTYDGDGKRVIKSNGSTGTLYWTGVGSDNLAESSLSGTISEEYMFFNGQRAARVDRPSNLAHFYFADLLGSSRATASVTNDVVSVESQEDYYPYGGFIAPPSDPNHYWFTGKERDTESGLDMFGARYYGSSLGRFMTPDWSPTPEAIPYGELSNPQSLNRYSYVKNNPTTLTDPDGHCDIDGEHHGWLWCAAHALNFTQTQHEQAENARFQLSFFGPFYRSGQAVDLQKMSDKDVIQFEKDFYIANALGQVRTIDANSVAGVALTTASQIANGHSWTKHQGEFPGWDKGKFESTVGDTMQNPDEVKSLSNNRTAYWNAKENMVVIKDSANADGGTAFRPTNGKAYFDGLK